MKVLSIDFDFFINVQDYMAMDTVEYKSTVWKQVEENLKSQGKSLEAEFPFAGPPFAEFLSHFDFRKTPHLDVWDTHLDILAFLQDKKGLEICNVDAHHDISSHEVLSEIHMVDCGNWGGYLISRGRVKSWTQVFPEWRGYRTTRKFEKRVAEAKQWNTPVVSKSLSEIRKFVPDILFICRSSPWVPPIYDATFDEFCKLVSEKGKFKMEEPRRFPRDEDTRLLRYITLEQPPRKKK